MGDASNRPLWPILLAAVVFVTVAHFLTLTVAFTYASGWDNACDILYRGQTDSYNTYSWRQTDRTYYTDPGFACEYLVDDTTVTLRKDLTGARNTTWAATLAAALAAAASVAIYLRRQHQHWLEVGVDDRD
jgi:ABC-type Fe3+ transport system permease subunit